MLCPFTIMDGDSGTRNCFSFDINRVFTDKKIVTRLIHRSYNQ